MARIFIQATLARERPHMPQGERACRLRSLGTSPLAAEVLIQHRNEAASSGSGLLTPSIHMTRRDEMSYGARIADGRQVELCDECGFDGRDVADDAAELVAVCGRLAALVDERQDASERPGPEIFSATEYVQHSVEVIEGILGYIATVIGIQAPQVGDLGTAVGVARAILPSITADQRAALLYDKYRFPASVDWLLQHLLHDLQHHVLDIRRGYACITMSALPEVYTSRRDRPL